MTGRRSAANRRWISFLPILSFLLCPNAISRFERGTEFLFLSVLIGRAIAVKMAQIEF